MPTLLQIHSSLFGADGQSSQLAEQFVAKWRNTHPNGQVYFHDFSENPIPHLDAAQVQGLTLSPELRSPRQQALITASDALIAEIRQADTIVIGLPMYNLGTPSTLKAYFDQIARAGVTFRYTENGPEGLLTGKKAYIFATRGGQYAETPFDSQTNYVQNFLGFLGINDVEFIYAERLNMGDANKKDAIKAAEQRLAELVA